MYIQTFKNNKFENHSECLDHSTNGQNDHLPNIDDHTQVSFWEDLLSEFKKVQIALMYKYSFFFKDGLLIRI